MRSPASWWRHPLQGSGGCPPVYQGCCPQASLRLLCSTSEPRAKLQSHFWVFKETRPPRLLLSRLGPLGLRATLPVKRRQPPSPDSRPEQTGQHPLPTSPGPRRSWRCPPRWREQPCSGCAPELCGWEQTQRGCSGHRRSQWWCAACRLAHLLGGQGEWQGRASQERAGNTGCQELFPMDGDTPGYFLTRASVPG